MFGNNDFRPATLIRHIGIVLLLVMQAGLLQANSADVTTTVTVVPRVEALTVSAIPLGSSSLNPGEKESTVLALSVHNTFTEAKSLSSLTIHDASRGAGTPAQLLSNIDSLFLYKDTDGDSLVSVGDSLLVADAWDATDIALTLGSLDVGSDSSMVLLLAVNAALFPHDGDTVDAFLRPASDIETTDATPVAGPDSLNSLGYRVIDGLVAAQLNTPATGLTSIGTGDTVYNVFTVDIPRNGYSSDTLRSFTVHNSGTADDTDLEFMVLFSDNGDGLWGGLSEEILVAPLEYIGAHWAASNLNVPLTAPTTRFFVGAKALPYPVNGSTLIPGVPEYGLLMASRNDGPLDNETTPVDTIEIQSEEGLLVTSTPLSPGVLIPGEISAPAFAFELKNGSSEDVSLDSLSVQLDLVDLVGGASTAELESQFDSLLLYMDGDGDLTSIGPSDVLVSTAGVTDGPCLFATGGLQIDASGGEIGLSIVLATNLSFACNGNTAEISLESETDLFIDPVTSIFGSFPVTDGPLFTVDAFPAVKVIVNALAAANFYGGQTNMPVLDFVVPDNGYAVDTLQQLVVENVGNVEDDVALEALNLWCDRLNDGFSADDILVTGFTRGALTWTATNFSQFVPVGGQRMILTADISEYQFDGGTLAMTILPGGMTYASGMIGPDDDEIADGSTHLIVPPQRITVVSVPSPSVTVRPAQTKNTVLTFALYNGYINEDKTLKSIRFENISRSLSDADFADYEIGRLRLYYDANADRILNGDPLIGSGYFQNGALTVGGLNLSLPPESLAYFFVQSDVAIDAIDSDSLGVRINGIADFYFQEQVSINGDLPLTSGGWLVIDGSVKCQYDVLPLASRSVNQGETLVPVMTFRPAVNGDQVDTLVLVTVMNTGTADTADITDLRLWCDSNGDDTWQITDAIMGSFSYTGSWWTTGGFSLPVPSSAPTLFVTADVSPTATDERTMALSIPQNGCLYTSDNDGPLDSALVCGAQFTITGSNLRIACHPYDYSYSVGQTIEVSFFATNLSGVTMDSVTGSCSPAGDVASVQLDSVQLGPASVAPADSAEFTAYYTAVEPGTVYWHLQAVELATDDSSSELTTEPILVQAVPTHIDIDFVSSMPATVTLGQKNIIPITLGFIHGDSSPDAASAVLDSLSLHVYDGGGNPLAANDVFSRVRIITDEMYTAEPSEIPASDRITFVFNPAVEVAPGQERSASVVIDIDSLTTAVDFALALSDASSVIFRDHNSGAEVSVISTTGFPLATPTTRIDRPPDQLLIAVSDQSDQNVNLDQDGARLLRISLRHPGTPGTAPIQVTGLSIGMQDNAYVSLAFSEVFEAVHLIHGGSISAVASGGALNTDTLTLSFSSPPILGPGDTDIIDLEMDVRPDAQISRVRLTIADSTRIAARNFSTGETVPANLDMDIMPAGSVFPLYSGWIQLRYPAQAPLICMNSAPYTSVLAGADNVSLMSIVLMYPATGEYSSLYLRDLSLIVLDTNDLALDPRSLFDRLGYIVDSSAVEYQASVNPVNGQTVFEFGDEGILIDPSDTVTIRLVADLDAGVPYDHFLLRVGSLEALRFSDATDSLQHPVALLDVDCASTIPFVAGPLSILWPAGRPTLTPESSPLTMISAGQRNVLIFDAVVDYGGLVPRGDLVFESFTGEFFKRTKDGLEVKSGSAVFESLRLRVDEVTWANDSSLSTATFALLATGEYHIVQGTSLRFQLRGDLQPGAPPGNYLYQFSDSTFLVFSDNNLDTLLYPVLTAGSFPVFSTELNISAADLTGSFSNYPNPFVPSREETTTFGYFLSEDADVEIALYTVTGEFVAKVVDDVRKSAGVHSEDRWDGRNDRGLKVAPGTYIGVITAHYVSGGKESAKRKVTVVR